VPFLWRVLSTLGGGAIVIERIPATDLRAWRDAVGRAVIAWELGGRLVADPDRGGGRLRSHRVGLGHLLITATVDLLSGRC